MSNASRSVLRLACPNFTASETDALRSLLHLIKPYLKQAWEITDRAQPDLILVNLDHPQDSPAMEAIPRAGCAQRPRLHPAGTLHRPLRVPELLALLTDVGARQSQNGAQSADLVEFQYHLRMWPLDIEQWPKQQLRVMATICGASHSAEEIVGLTNLPATEVKACLLKLQDLDLIDRYAKKTEAVTRVVHPFRSLARRVGQILGFRQ